MKKRKIAHGRKCKCVRGASGNNGRGGGLQQSERESPILRVAAGGYSGSPRRKRRGAESGRRGSALPAMQSSKHTHTHSERSPGYVLCALALSKPIPPPPSPSDKGGQPRSIRGLYPSHTPTTHSAFHGGLSLSLLPYFPFHSHSQHDRLTIPSL